jgi:hypothetical protein
MQPVGSVLIVALSKANTRIIPITIPIPNIANMLPPPSATKSGVVYPHPQSILFGLASQSEICA